MTRWAQLLLVVLQGSLAPSRLLLLLRGSRGCYCLLLRRGGGPVSLPTSHPASRRKATAAISQQDGTNSHRSSQEKPQRGREREKHGQRWESESEVKWLKWSCSEVSRSRRIWKEDLWQLVGSLWKIFFQGSDRLLLSVARGRVNKAGSDQPAMGRKRKRHSRGMDDVLKSRQMVSLWFSLVPSFKGFTDDCVSFWSLSSEKKASQVSTD